MIKTKCWHNPSRWHKWYAWRPVWTGYSFKGNRICETMVWFEEIWRRHHSGWGSSCWEYSLTEPKDD